MLFFVNAKIIEQYTIGGYREYSVYKNLFHFRYLQVDITIQNLRGHNRTLETIMLHPFNRSSLLKYKITFVKFVDFYRLLLRTLNQSLLWLFMRECPKIFFQRELVYSFYK